MRPQTLEGPSAPGRGGAKSFIKWSGPQGSASLSHSLGIPGEAVILYAFGVCLRPQHDLRKRLPNMSCLYM